MDFKGMGDTFQDIHPIMNVLGSGWVAISIFLLGLLLVVALYMTSEKSKYINLLLLLTASIIFIIAEGVVGYSFIMKNFYATPYIYGGEAKVQHVSPVDDDMKQKIILKNKDGERVLELPKTKIDGLEKNDEVTMQYTYHKSGILEVEDTDERNTYINQETHKPKKHVDFEDMTDLEDDIELKKKVK